MEHRWRLNSPLSAFALLLFVIVIICRDGRHLVTKRKGSGLRILLLFFEGWSGNKLCVLDLVFSHSTHVQWALDPRPARRGDTPGSQDRLVHPLLGVRTDPAAGKRGSRPLGAVTDIKPLGQLIHCDKSYKGHVRAMSLCYRKGVCGGRDFFGENDV